MWERGRLTVGTMYFPRPNDLVVIRIVFVFPLTLPTPFLPLRLARLLHLALPRALLGLGLGGACMRIARSFRGRRGLFDVWGSRRQGPKSRNVRRRVQDRRFASPLG